MRLRTSARLRSISACFAFLACMVDDSFEWCTSSPSEFVHTSQFGHSDLMNRRHMQGRSDRHTDIQTQTQTNRHTFLRSGGATFTHGFFGLGFQLSLRFGWWRRWAGWRFCTRRSFCTRRRFGTTRCFCASRRFGASWCFCNSRPFCASGGFFSWGRGSCCWCCRSGCFGFLCAIVKIGENNKKKTPAKQKRLVD